MDKIILSPIELCALLEGIRHILKEELITKQHSELDEKLLSPVEACKLFKPAVCSATLSNWAKRGKLKQYRIGTRVFYKYADIIASLQTLKKYEHTFNNN